MSSKNVLVIGGTRNMGYYLVLRLLDLGHQVTVLNRGISRDELPDSVHRLHVDRENASQIRRALFAKEFDVVIDFVLFEETSAKIIVDILQDTVGHYVMLSTGQVYLVREGIETPYQEEDYAGDCIAMPPKHTYAYEEWVYGMEKRQAEDVLMQAHTDRSFPVTVLRLPMVNSTRDTHLRLWNYILRLQDTGTILVPDVPRIPLRHVYAKDVVRAIELLITSGKGKGRAYNLTQDETVSLDGFIQLVADYLGVKPDIRHYDREVLAQHGFLPYCSPFSEIWMSVMDNRRSKEELGTTYTPLQTYLPQLIQTYLDHKPRTPVGYKRRRAERRFADETPAIV